MLEAKASGSTESKPYQTLLAFKPRQVLLAAAHNTKATQMSKQNTKTLNPQQEVNLLHSVLCYLESRGYSKALKRLLSDSKIEKDGWKTSLLKLEDLYISHLERSTSVDSVTDAIKEQEDDATKKKTKKKSHENAVTSDSVVGNVEDYSLKSLKGLSAGTVHEQLADESNLKQDKKKKKTKSTSKAVDSDTEHVALDSQSQGDGKLKDKKKKGSSSAAIECTEQYKSAPEPISEIPFVEKENKSKDKKRKKEGSESGVLTVTVAEVSHQEGSTKEETLDDAVDKQRKGSKKRRRLNSDEKDVKPVEELGHGNELVGKESEGQNAHVLNESKSTIQEPKGIANDAKQKGKIQRNGSAEPRTVNAFQRVKVDEVEFVDERLQDNSYWAKDGAEIGYGAKAQEVLGQVRGRDFRHEKTKKKRGSYRGGQIDLHSHSVKFNYDDED